MLKKTLFALAMTTAITSPAFAATNLLVNGSFEDGFNGWTVGGTTDYPPSVIDYNSSAGYPTGAFGEPVGPDNAVGNPGLDAVGGHAAYFVSDIANPQTLTQTVTLQAGVTYTFGFDVYKPANGNANPNGAAFTASLNGVEFASFTASELPVQTWQHYFATTSFAAPATGDFTFSFTSNGFPAKDFVIDRVYLSALPVPEPTTWAMLIAGFGLVGGAMRTRRRAGYTLA